MVAHAENIVHQIGQDYSNYYSLEHLPTPLFGLSISGVLANTGLDTSLQTRWQQDLPSQQRDLFARTATHFGDLTQYYYAIPAYLIAMSIGATVNDNALIQPLGIWGSHCLRMLALGAPQQLLLTHLLGAGRPQTGAPQWHLFAHHQAVSGHAFYGAIPLLAIAQQNHHILAQTFWYGLSTLPGLARVYQNKHYSSQAFLGWWLAFSAMQILPPTTPATKHHWQLYVQQNTIFLGMAIKI